ncbi:MAG: hypothetical protein DWH82_10450 [Planctomycetota bacterium]|nr:MAG: hypothetical protein DWH82_10450 [Planctomycetota bacterium]
MLGTYEIVRLLQAKAFLPWSDSACCCCRVLVDAILPHTRRQIRDRMGDGLEKDLLACRSGVPADPSSRSIQELKQ